LVLLVGEYSGREGLPAVFRRWAKAGIAVHTFDCHGHGKSEPHEEWDRFLVWDFNHLVRRRARMAMQYWYGKIPRV
jgi:alpha-beta hydrolase superfamily lysophospholipase